MGLRSLVRHITTYSTGSFLVALAGFISFPILTRVFSVGEYGVLNLVSATLLMLVGVAKLGQQHSVLRFYGSNAASGDAHAVRQFYTTSILGMLTSSVIVTLLWIGATLVLPESLWEDPRVKPMFLLTAVLIVIRTLDSGLVNLLRAQQRSATLSAFGVVKRYGSVGLVLVAVLGIAPTLEAFYAATVVAEVLAFAALASIVLRGADMALAHFSTPLLRSMLAYGIPMIGYELAGLMLSLGDRYALQILLDSRAVGLYAAAYNVCEYVQTILVVSLAQAAVPMFLKTWEEHGRAATERLLDNTLYLYVLAAAPVVFGMWAIAPELIATLAGSKYAASDGVVPWVMTGMVIDGAMPLLAAGLYVQKQSQRIMALVAGAAVFNIAANVALIPVLGIIGAAVSTFLAYLGLAVATYFVSGRHLKCAIPWPAVVRATAAAASMWVAVRWIELDSAGMTLAVKVSIGAAVYGVVLLAIDARARGSIQLVLSRTPRTSAS